MARSLAYFNVIFFCFLLLSFVYVGYLGLRNLFRYNVYHKELTLKRSELAELLEINQGYKQTILAMKKDGFWILEIKKNLGYIQNGEKVYKFYK